MDKSGIFRTLTYLQRDIYSEHFQRFKMECFAKIVKSYIYFFQPLFLRFLTWLWICPSLSKYSLTCRLTSRYVFMRHLQNPVFYCKSRHIHILFRHIQPYRVMFRTLCNSCNIHNFAKDPTHVQNSVIWLYSGIQPYSIAIVIITSTFSFFSL